MFAHAFFGKCDLLKQGISVWYDTHIETSERWWAKIEQQLVTCKAFIVIMSENAVNSIWVDKECVIAIEAKLPIFPVLLSGNRWRLFADTQYENVRGNKMPSEIFINGLRKHIGQPSSGSSFSRSSTPKEDSTEGRSPFGARTTGGSAFGRSSNTDNSGRRSPFEQPSSGSSFSRSSTPKEDSTEGRSPFGARPAGGSAFGGSSSTDDDQPRSPFGQSSSGSAFSRSSASKDEPNEGRSRFGSRVPLYDLPNTDDDDIEYEEDDFIEEDNQISTVDSLIIFARYTDYLIRFFSIVILIGVLLYILQIIL